MIKRLSISIIFITVISVVIVCGVVAHLEASSDSEHPYICVKGILFDNDVPLALINQVVVGVGDTISGVKVTEISSAVVQFEYKGEAFTQQVGVCGDVAVPSFVDKEAIADKMEAAFDKNEITEAFFDGMSEEMPQMQFSNEDKVRIMGVLAGIYGFILIGCFLVYIFSAICFQKIAKKTGTENGWLAWIPIASIYLMIRIADKPGWWLLLFFVPIANIIVPIIIFIEIAKACNKHGWIGLLFFLPGINLVVLGCLAFSKDAKILEEQTVQPQESKPLYQG